MSFDLVKIQQDVLSIGGGVDEDTRAVAGAGNYKRLSLKGGVFRKFVGGKETAAIEDRHLNVIFIKMAHNASRQYYKDMFKEDVKASPLCWSQDGEVPDPVVTQKQASQCKDCPQSIKGSGNDGNGTACRISWRTAVVLANDPAGDVLQLQLPATSVFGKAEGGKYPFKAYVQLLANNQISAGRVVTKMQFDTSVAQPKLVFSPVAAVPADVVPIIAEQSKTEEAENAIRIIVAPPREESPVAAAATPPVPTPTTSEESIPEPTVRVAPAKVETPKEDLSEIVKKWAAKKKA